jgi:regulator of cell morphogenesis and NO signaling
MPTSTQSIREIVASQPSAAIILQRFDIDLCLHADESLNHACAGLQLSVDQVLEKLSDAAANEHGAVPADLASYSLSRLIQHIVRAHHQYVRRELPRLAEVAHILAGKHDYRAPELAKIKKLLDELRVDMLAHLQKEEQVLFPFIAEMDQDSTASCSPPRACFRTVAQPVSMMIREHESAEGLVATMRSLTNGFTPQKGACPIHIALYAGLCEFETDLRQHVHLEDDVLFPRAIELEAELNRRG